MSNRSTFFFFTESHKPFIVFAEDTEQSIAIAAVFANPEKVYRIGEDTAWAIISARQQDSIVVANIATCEKAEDEKLQKQLERRYVSQYWYESDTKTGWDSNGWYLQDSLVKMGENFEIVEILDYDKHGNPIKAIAEKI